MASLAGTLIAGWRLLLEDALALAGWLVLGELVLAVACLAFVLATPGRCSGSRALAWFSGFGLTAAALSRPWQERLADSSEILTEFNVNDTIYVYDMGSYLSASLAFGAGLIGATLGLLFFALESGDKIVIKQIADSTKEDDHWMGFIIAIGLAAIAPTFPLAEYWAASAEPLPRFEKAETSGAVARITSLAPGGRTVRVALIQAEDPARVPLRSTFPDLGSGWPWSPPRSKRSLERLLQKDEHVRGEIWLATSDGVPRTWESLPGGFLEVVATGPGWVEVKLRDKYPPVSPFALVAIQYGARRSRQIAERASPERVQAEFASRRGGRLLADTFSPSVRVVRSAPFGPGQAPFMYRKSR